MSRKRKPPYAEGDWFAVPLRAGGYGVGVVARADGKGGVIGYFFGPRLATPPELEALSSNTPNSAVLVANLGDLGLLRGEWKLLGRHRAWKREEWPIPVFVRRDAVTGQPRKIIYSEPDLNSESAVLPCTETEAEVLPRDGVMGYGAVEIRLTRLLA